jgi:hypothetical protein
MTGHTTWRTDDPCPLCGTGLTAISTTDGTQTDQYCNLCGWSITWQVDLDLTTHRDPARPGADAK